MTLNDERTGIWCDRCGYQIADSFDEVKDWTSCPNCDGDDFSSVDHPGIYTQLRVALAERDQARKELAGYQRAANAAQKRFVKSHQWSEAWHTAARHYRREWRGQRALSINLARRVVEV